MSKEEWFAVAVVALMLSYVVALCAVGAVTQKGCLAFGYPSFKIDYTFSAYCVKRVDQTDVVERLEKLRGR